MPDQLFEVSTEFEDGPPDVRYVKAVDAMTAIKAAKEAIPRGTWRSSTVTFHDRKPLNCRIGWISKLLTPGYSDCTRCRTTWAFVQGHNTRYTQGRSCFPLCRKCWAELTPETRLPYYEKMLKQWDHTDETTKERIRQAVRNGL